MHPRFQRLLGSNGFSIGLELPLDNDWSSDGQRLRIAEDRPFGVPDLKQHAAMARLADKAGFRALWVRDVPVYDPDFGDAAQVFETFSYLGYLAGITDNIMLGTAAVVLPLRQPWLTLKAANSVDELSDGRLLLGVASGDRPMEYPLFGWTTISGGRSFAIRSSCCAAKVKDACRKVLACYRSEISRCHCWLQVLVSNLQRGSANTWTAGSPTPALRMSIVAEWDCGGRSVAINPTSASFTWIWRPILMHRCGVYVSAAAAGGWH